MDNFQEKISVIIPVYNAEKYLNRCVDSVLKQTYSNYEIIIVDDGSTDDSAKICDRYCKDYENISVIHQKNAGVSVARNKGIEKSTGKYLAFIDSDDWVDSRYLEVLYSGIKECDAQISVVGHKSCNEQDDDDIYKEEKEDLRYQFRTLNREESIANADVKSYIWSRLYSKDIIVKTRFPENIIIKEDTAFNVLILCDNSDIKIAYSSVPLYFHSQNQYSVMHTIPHSQVSKVGLFYWANVGNMLTEYGNNLMLLESIRTFLSVRYLSMFENDKEENDHISKLIKKARRRLTKKKGISVKDRFIYSIFMIFPFTYRLYRIITDPTMLKWEKSEKEKRKELNICAESSKQG